MIASTNRGSRAAEATRTESEAEPPLPVTAPVHEEAPEGSFAAGYAWHHRAYELMGITACLVTGAMAAHRLATHAGGNAWVLPLGTIAGMHAADGTSGFVHWLFDTWGSTDTPVLGQLAIRTFREHHVDEKAICGHDFVETNGHNMALSVLPFSLALLVGDPSGALGAFLLTAAVSWGVFVSMTSQIHKWAHMKAPPRAIAWLQRRRVLLSAEHHSVHHGAPYDDNYCITVGWLNGPLRMIGFFRGLERAITMVTGVPPRKNDLIVTGVAKDELGAGVFGRRPSSDNFKLQHC